MDEAKTPYRIDDLEAVKLGYAPGSIGIPVRTPGWFAVMGLSSDYSVVKISPDTYRMAGRRLTKTGVKTYNEVGMVNGLDLDLQSHARLRAAIGYAGEVRKALKALKTSISEALGGGMTTCDTLPAEFRVINAALGYKSKGKMDHARLVLRWPWLFPAFSSDPRILDNAVAGTSLWELLPKEFDHETAQEMRRVKDFESTWIQNGVATPVYIKTLAAACSCIPTGGQRPTSASQASTLISLANFYDSAFRDLPLQVRRMMKIAAVSKGENWRDGHGFNFGYTTDYVSYLYHNILVDCFRLVGLGEAPEQNLFAAATLIYGSDPRRIVEASDSWHEQQKQDGVLVGSVSNRRDHTAEASIWSSAIDTIQAPNGLFIVPLDTADDLDREGRGQHHCVYSHRRACADGKLRVASVRHVRDGHSTTLSTFSFARVEGELILREHRAFANGRPADDAVEAVVWFRDECNSDTPAFRLNTHWPMSIPKADANLRLAVLERFQVCKATFPKKLQKGGLDALLAACAG